MEGFIKKGKNSPTLNGLDKVREWIESRRLKRAVVNNAPRANAELMISLLGLLDFFHVVIIGGECEHAKPMHACTGTDAKRFCCCRHCCAHFVGAAIEMHHFAWISHALAQFVGASPDMSNSLTPPVP
ncbi:Haloacid dehalogenase-like hydrolase domain-containing protein Sgpp [Arachis hypogaea]|nr:Haloacid dehalogenase-like hydrolase domain-containing protein Sgpp [Arachis hypogaea]